MDLLELTIPDKPRGGRQRYRLTAAGRRVLAGLTNQKSALGLFGGALASANRHG